MARPLKQGLDYFPLDVKLEQNYMYLQSKHGVKAFVYVYLLQQIYSNSYYLEIKPKDIKFLSANLNMDKEEFENIILDCIDIDMFDNDLYMKYNILTSKGIQKRYIEASSRRKEIIIENDFLLIQNNDEIHEKYKGKLKVVNSYNNWVNVYNNYINAINNLINVYRSTQSKVK